MKKHNLPALVIGASKQILNQNKTEIKLLHTTSMAYCLQPFGLAE